MIRLLILIVIAVFSICLGRFWLDDSSAVRLFAKTGYWFVTLNFAVFCFCLYRAYVSHFRFLLKNCGKRCLIPCIVIGLSLLFISRSETMGFKTIMDEHLIASTARGLHMDREATASMRVHHTSSRQILMSNTVDKRPIFMPYLTSLLHDVGGYHPENSIRLNVFVLCPLLFVLLYVLGYRLWGVWGGALMCGLIATIPLCGFIFRGGGLEILNMVMIVALLLIAMDFWEASDVYRCGALCLGATLLAQTRYESVIFILPVAILIALVWLRRRRVEVYWPVLLCPILLIPYLWQNRVFSLNEKQWQLEGKERPFGFEYFADNLERAVYYFFNVDSTVPNSWLLPVASVVMGMFLVLLLVRILREKRMNLDSGLVPLGVFLLGFFALFILLLCYSWDFGGTVVQRLCLPLYIPMALCVVVFCVVSKVSVVWLRGALVLGFFVYSFGYAIPVNSKRAYNMGVGWIEYEVIHAMLEAGELDPEGIYISENASFYGIYGYSCVSNRSANKNKQAIVNYIGQPGARPIYVATRLAYAGKGDEFFDRNYSRLDSDFELELVHERWMSISRKLIFSRVVGIEGYEPEVLESESTLDYYLKCMKMLP